MLVEDFDLALGLIKNGPGDQPLMRLLTFAMEASDCPMAVIGARRDLSHQVIVSRGIPLFMYRDVVQSTPEVAALFSGPTIIEDTWSHEQMSDGPLARDGWRYIVSVPLPLNILPFPVNLTCADVRVGVNRPERMMERLERCAAIAADEIRSISYISKQTRTTESRFRELDLLVDAVSQSLIPAMIVDDGMNVRAISNSTSQCDFLPAFERKGLSLPVGNFLENQTILKGISDLLKTGRPISALQIENTHSQPAISLNGIRCTSYNGNNFAVLTFRTGNDAIHCKCVAADNGRDSPSVVSDFLLNTIVRQKRLLGRGKISYHALARWRTPIKHSQIAALKAMKRDLTETFLYHVADELASAARSLFGQSTFEAVTHVPCGNSGPNCLAARLSGIVAQRLNIEALQAFETLPQSGGSHPKSNLRRPTMKMRSAPTKRILLIDDVATSGHHIEEAATLLGTSALAVMPMVWIGN